MTQVVVVGGGVAGLVAARAAVLGGADVTVLEAGSRPGGVVAGAELDGIALDVGAESLAVRGGRARELLAALGLETVAPAPLGAWVRTSDGSFPLPAAGVLGIPGSPLADDVRRVIGARASWRAWCDRFLPELTIGREQNLGRLVRRRMGAAVLEKLVAPVVGNVYAVDPDEADVDSLAPGLGNALAQHGSLSAAVLALRSAAPAGSAVVGIPGGMHTLVGALQRDLQRFGVDLRTGTAADALHRTDAGWDIDTRSERLPADRVVLAADGTSARRLLAPHLDAALLTDWPEAHRTAVVTLLLDAPALDRAPRGSGVLVGRGVPGVTAAALTHSSAKWPWLAEQLPTGRHAVRLSYRGASADRADAALALQDAANLLGVAASELQLVASHVAEWRQEGQRALLGMRARIGSVRDAVAALPGIDVTGAWISGTGLAAVVGHADGVGMPADPAAA